MLLVLALMTQISWCRLKIDPAEARKQTKCGQKFALVVNSEWTGFDGFDKMGKK